jgi:thiosulfate/3-mercaptopyruvate sulfurtransferase
MTKFNIIHNDKASSTRCEKSAGPKRSYVLGILMFSLIAFAPVAEAGCSCSAGNWDPSVFLNSELGTGQPVQSSNSQANAAASQPKTVARIESFPNGEIFKPMKSVSSSDVVLDVSNGESYVKSHIKNSIHIPTKNFLDDKGNLLTNEELAEVLGNAGVSRDDSVILYGNKESTGEAEFAFLVISYLGQKDVRLLDGSLADWQAAGLPVESSENRRPATEYKPEAKSEIMAEHEYVKSGKALIVDARPFVEFGKGRIPGSIALDPSTIIKGDRIKNGGDLSSVFSRLGKDKPIVVYSSDYSRSSLVWYALQLMGYKASIYTWEDWTAHEAAEVQTVVIRTGGDAAGSEYTKLGKT